MLGTPVALSARLGPQTGGQPPGGSGEPLAGTILGNASERKPQASQAEGIRNAA
jgi:hypothetical protein